MYGDIVGGFIGSFDLPYGPSADEIALLEGQEGAAEAVLAGVLVVGPRLGKFRRDGTTKPTPPPIAWW